MIGRLMIPLMFGAIGVGILLGLGFWQLSRLAEKEAYLADLEARIVAPPRALPAVVGPTVDTFLPVITTGTFTGEALNVLVSRKQIGPGVRIIEVFLTDTGRRILVDRGFVAEADRQAEHTATANEVTGNLHWPDEVDGFTPAPDTAAGLWFARDVPAMAAALNADPVLLVARSETGGGVAPLAVDASGTPNDHLEYAITWFSLAVVWAGMTGLLVWRIRRRTA
ncbi:MAG: SURF1 family protein [Rhodobacteraceae bacterium]|nr:SURF1 family protein [Paracoccaceae bacterium]